MYWLCCPLNWGAGCAVNWVEGSEAAGESFTTLHSIPWFLLTLVGSAGAAGVSQVVVEPFEAEVVGEMVTLASLFVGALHSIAFASLWSSITVCITSLNSAVHFFSCGVSW